MGVKYLRTVTDKEHHIKSVYAYDDDRNLLYCNFEFMSDSDYNSVPIGREYKFNSQGDITEIINHEEGYSICCEQAMTDIVSERQVRNIQNGSWIEVNGKVRKFGNITIQTKRSKIKCLSLTEIVEKYSKRKMFL